MGKKKQEIKRTRLPLPPQNVDAQIFEMEIYVRFMRHIRNVPTSRMEIKILSAIQFTADMMDQSDALVSKTLVDLGLLAPRTAFPHSFLEFVDHSLQRGAWSAQSASASVGTLYGHWNRIGESCFLSHLVRDYAVVSETVHS